MNKVILFWIFFVVHIQCAFTQSFVTKPTGGNNLCLTDDFQLLGDIVISETNHSDFQYSNGTIDSLYLQLPVGFEFNTTALFTVNTNGGDIIGTPVVSVSSSMLKIGLVIGNTASAQDIITVSGLEIKSTSVSTGLSLKRIATSDDVNFVGLEVATNSSYADLNSYAYPTGVTAGTDSKVCNMSTIPVLANDPTPFIGNWVALDGHNVTSAASYSTTVYGITPGDTGRFVWEVNNNGCITRDTVAINNKIVEVADAGTDISLCNTSTTTLSGNTPVVSTGLWTLVSGTATITTSTDKNTTVTGIPVGTTAVFEWELTNDICQSSDQMSVTNYSPVTVADAGTDVSLCNTTSTTLNANTPTTGTGLWSIVSGTASISTPTNPTTVVSGIGASNTVQFQWVIQNGACSSTDVVEVVNYAPATTAVAGATIELCNTTTATLNANAAVIGTGQWSVVSGIGTVTDVLNPTSGVTGVSAGNTLKLQWEIVNGSCTSSDLIELTNYQVPTVADAGTDFLLCDVVTGNLGANTPSVGVGTWNTSSVATIAAVNLATSSISNLSFDESYSFVWEITNGVCPSTKDTITVTVNATPTQPTVITGDNSVCEDEVNVAYSVPPVSYATTYNWTIPSGDAAFAATSQTENVILDFSGTTNSLLEVTAGNICGVSPKQTLNITQNSLPSPVTISGNATPDCNNTTTEFYQANTAPLANETYTWTVPAGAVIIGQNDAQAVGVQFGSTNGKVSLLVTNTLTGCQNSFTYDVVLNCGVSFTVSSPEICSGEQVVCTNTTVGASPSAVYKWTIDGVVYNGEGPHTVSLTTTNTRDVVATLEVTDGSVSTVSNLVRVNELPSLSLVPSPVSCFGGNNGVVDLTVTGGIAGYDYVWLPTNTTNEDLTNVTSGSYQVTVTDSKSCVQTNSVTINEPGVLVSSLVSKSDVSVFGGTDGQATITTSGGVLPYIYSWVPSSQLSSTLTNVESGTHVATITDGNGCTKQFDVTITEPSELFGGTISIENVADDGVDVCRLEMLPNLENVVTATGGTGNYTYDWQHSEDFGMTWSNYPTSNSEQFSPNTSINEFTQVRRRVVDNQGALKYSNTLNFIFRDTTNVSVVHPAFPSADYCEGKKELQLYEVGNESGINGSYVGPSVIDYGDGTAFLDMQTSGSGIQYYTYTYTNSFGCVSKLNKQIQVFKTPTVRIDGLIANYSASSPNDTAVLTPPFSLGGGYLTGNGLESDTIFNPIAGDIQTNIQDTITYTYTDQNGCMDVAKHLFRVNSANGSINNLNAERAYCIYHDDIVLEGNSAGGNATDFKVFKLKQDGTIEMSGGNPVELATVWKSTTMDTLQFDFNEVSSYYTPTISFVDVLFVFSYTDQGASFEINEKVRVFNKPQLTFNMADLDYCENEDTLDLTPFVSPYQKEAGIFTKSTGIYQDTLFIPANGAVDSKDTLLYIFQDPISHCVDSISQVVEVNSLPVVTIFGFGTKYCENDSKVTIKGTPLPGANGAGVFTGPSLVNSGAGQVEFSPNASVKNTDVTVTYQYTDLNTGCINSAVGQFRVDSIPVVGIKGLKPSFCENEEVQLIGTVGGIDATFYSSRPSYFSGDVALIVDTNVTDAQAKLMVDSSIDFNRDYVVGYTFTDGNSCTATYQETISVDSLPVVSFTTASYGYCSDQVNTAVITPNVSGGQVTVNGLPQGVDRTINLASIGMKKIDYEVTASTGCTSVYTDSIYVNLTPNIFFEVSSNCIVDTINFEQFAITLLPAGTPPLNFVQWDWDFGDLGNNDTSTLDKPSYKYSTQGLRTIKVTTTTDSSCVSTTERTIPFYSNPEADFTWGNVCVGQQATEFVNQSTPADLVDSSFWGFADGSPVVKEFSPQHQFANSEAYQVQLVVKTTSGCIDTVVKTVDLFPFEHFDNGVYSQDFEQSSGGWFSSSVDSSKNSWELASVLSTSPIINTANSGNQVYVTNADGDYLDDEFSYVTSPCFAFDELERPMVKFAYLSAFTDQDDGVTLQYEYTYRDENGDMKTSAWANLGDRNNQGLATGINWYNSSTIDSKPGGLNSRGWTGMSVLDGDTTWLEARHELDFMLEEVEALNGDFISARLRFALGSDLQSGGEGFAFDDFWIGNRTRTVLYEHFTNTLCTSCVAADLASDQVVDRYFETGDIVEIQYHTGSPHNDPLYNENPAAANKRSFFYSVPIVPYSVMGGNQFAGTTDDWVSDSLNVRLRALSDPLFDLDITSNESEVTIDVRANMEIAAGDDIVLYVAVVDNNKDISSLGIINNGQTVFKRVIHKFLPNSAGTLLDGEWKKGDTKHFTFDYNLNGVVGSDLGLVVFVQDNEANGTKEVYQAGYAAMSLVNGVENQLTSSEFAIYPNPSSGEVTIQLPDYNHQLEVSIYSTLGVKIHERTVMNSIGQLHLKLTDLPEGMYLVKIKIDEEKELVGKLLLQTR